MRRPARGRLALRIYALGIAQLVLLAVVGVLLAWINGPPPPPDPAASAQYRGSDGVVHPLKRPTFAGPLLTLLAGLLLFGAGALLTAHWILGPLSRLTAAARALGEGNLRARVGLDRDDELGEVGRAFDEMAVRMELLVRAEKELLANVSHELRTPLARLRVALELAEEGDAESARMSLGEMALDLSEIEELIDNILAATRLELAEERVAATGFELQRELVEPGVLAERAAERFRGVHPGRALSLMVDAGLPALRVDPMLFRRVIDNLLANAAKYSPDDGPPVALRVLRDDAGVAFEVEDHGEGIAASDLPQIFTAFFRGDRSRTRGTGGVGLGLTLAKRIVEAHGGTIAVRSVEQVGTTMRVVVPAAEPARLG